MTRGAMPQPPNPDEQETLAQLLADFLGTVEEVVEAEITDADVERRLDRLLHGDGPPAGSDGDNPGSRQQIPDECVSAGSADPAVVCVPAGSGGRRAAHLKAEPTTVDALWSDVRLSEILAAAHQRAQKIEADARLNAERIQAEAWDKADLIQEHARRRAEKYQDAALRKSADLVSEARQTAAQIVGEAQETAAGLLDQARDAATGWREAVRQRRLLTEILANDTDLDWVDHAHAHDRRPVARHRRPSPKWTTAGQVHCPLVAVSASGGGDCEYDLRLHQRKALYELLRGAFDAAGIGWRACLTQDRGDGVVALLPPDALPEQVLDGLIGQMWTGLLRHNRSSSGQEHMSLRMAVHMGVVGFGTAGPAGRPLDLLCRMLDAPEIDRHRRGDLALIASEYVFENLIREHSELVDPETYEALEITAGEVRHRAWRCFLPSAGVPQSVRLSALRWPMPALRAGSPAAGETVRGNASALRTP